MDQTLEDLLELMNLGLAYAIIDPKTGKVLWKSIVYATDEDRQNALREGEIRKLYASGEAE